MHEAGIAAVVVATIRDRRLDPGSVRLVVSAGLHDPLAFEAALRAHLVAIAPDLGLEAVAIIRAPAERLCVACLARFDAVEVAAGCPTCGGPSIAVDPRERVELEWDDRVPDRPASGDARPSPTPSSAGEAIGMRVGLPPGRA